VIAHAGDWIAGVLLGGPALAFGAWLLVVQIRERRAGRESRSS